MEIFKQQKETLQFIKQNTNQQCMDPKDFEGIYKWKFFVPAVYIINWTLIIVGPLFFPFAYQIYCMIITVYSALKTLGLCLGTLVSLVMLKRTLNRIKEKQESNAQLNSQLLHAIVIPSYKQDEEVLIDTLKQLGKSSLAKNKFIVFLAMEAHQQKSDIKANSIIFKTKHMFYHADFTQHKVRQGQAKGKASNVSWCVQHFQQKLKPLMIDLDKIIITVIDADSWAPKQYFDELQRQIIQYPQKKDVCLFSAPQIYTRNHLQVPIFNRTYDTMHSLVHLSNLVAVKFSFPLSNYSVSYNLMKRIGWWDTCADAIGQDFHTCQKISWKVQKQSIYTSPIYVPFNQCSLSTGEGYCKDIAARFWQAQRHTLGVSDVAYSFNMLFKTPFMMRNLWLTSLVIQVFTMAAVIPWALLGLSLQYKLLNDPTIQYFPGWSIQILLNAATVLTLLSYIFYQWWRRVANKQVYNQQNDAWWRVFQYPIIFTFALFGFSIPSFIMASFAVLCTTTQYRVAQKHIQKKEEFQASENPVLVIKHKSLEKRNSLLNNANLQKRGSIQKKVSVQKKNSIQKKESIGKRESILKKISSLKQNKYKVTNEYENLQNQVNAIQLHPNVIQISSTSITNSQTKANSQNDVNYSVEHEQNVQTDNNPQ